MATRHFVRRAAGALLLPSALTVSAANSARPEVGRHAAELCVTAMTAEPSCGPAQVDLRRDGSVRIRIDDIVYRMQLRGSQIDVVLMHGAVQVDEFSVAYEWVGNSLKFNDDDRRVRYEVRFAQSRR